MRIDTLVAWRGALLAVTLTCATAGTAMGQWLELPLPVFLLSPIETLRALLAFDGNDAPAVRVATAAAVPVSRPGEPADVDVPEGGKHRSLTRM